MTVFLHNNDLETTVQGQIEQNGYATVTEGSYIAEVGGWGPDGANTYGYHVHLEVYKKNCQGNWERVDPYGDGTNGILWKQY